MAAFPHDSSISSSVLFSPPALNFDQPNTAFLLQHNLDHTNHNEDPCVFSVTNKNSMDSSSVITHKYFDHPTLLPLDSSINKKRKQPKHSNSSPNSAQSKDMRELKAKKQKKLEKEAPPTGFIHVRARRGQATDSHSLAERVRRERISERMKLLQSLVPGCDKVTGKALMLDEIINYVQSLQNQVEFLSMKLASVNPMMYDFGMDLESLMVRPDQAFQECSPTTANNTYPLLDNSPPNSFLLQQQSQIPYALPQEEKQTLWGLDERQKIMNNSNSLFSFPLM